MTRGGTIDVKKADGVHQPFDENKLRASLARAGAPNDLVALVIREVGSQIRADDSTDRVRKLAIRSLRRHARSVANRYNLKRGIRDLGPTGYPFERLWGAVMTALGFSVSFDVLVGGRCIHHEIDVLGERNKQLRFAECKFHNDASRRTDVKVALYFQARRVDVEERAEASATGETFELVTNTRFTEDAITYGRCVGLPLVSWDYPRGKSLRDLIDRHALYPITCLSRLRKRDQRALFALDVVTCRGLVTRPECLRQIGLSEREAAAVLHEAEPLQHIAEVNENVVNLLAGG